MRLSPRASLCLSLRARARFARSRSLTSPLAAAAPLHRSYLEGLELTRDAPFHVALVWPCAVRALFVSQFFFWIQALGRVSLWLSFVCVTLSVLGVYYLMLWRIRAVEAQLPFERMDDARHLREIFGFTPLLASDDDDAAGAERATELSGGGGARAAAAAAPVAVASVAIAGDAGSGLEPVKAVFAEDAPATRLGGPSTYSIDDDDDDELVV